MLIRSRLGSIVKSDYFRHVATLVSGTTLAQAVPILIAPILTRIYTTAEYGLLALFMSVSMVISILSTLQYTHAVLLAKEDKDSIQLLQLCLLILGGMTVLTTVFVVLGNEWLAAKLKFPDLAPWLYLIPVAVFLNGLVQVFTIWANRNVKYTRLSTADILAALITGAISLSLGYMGFGVVGLILGYLVGMGLRAIFLTVQALRMEPNILISPDFKVMREQAVSFKKFPVFHLPSLFTNTLISRLPVFMLSILLPNSIGIIGLFNMTNRILALPTSLISGAIGSVFKQRAAKEYNETGSCERTYIVTFKTLLAVGVVPFAILFIYAPDLFAFVFGEEWRDSGIYAQCLSLMFFLQFISKPLSYLYSISSRQGENLIAQLALLVLVFIGFYVGFVYLKDEVQTFWIYTGISSLFYLYFLLRSYKFSKGP
jgi:O-antigen/teichoic acid export membrane protein